MSARWVACFLVVLGLGSWMTACGGGPGASDMSEFDGGMGRDTGGGSTSDVTLHTPPPGSGDGGQRLHTTDSGGTGLCKPKTCAELNATCGEQGDGCNSTPISCGTCTAPETCGGGGVPNHCGGGDLDAGDGSIVIPMGTLSIAPLNATITVPYGQTNVTKTYTAKVGTTSVAASFSIDLGQIVSIDPSTGVLTALGKVGGVANVTATFNMQTVSTPVTVVITMTQNGAAPVPDGGVDAGGDASNAGGNGGVGGEPAGGPVSMGTQTLLQGTPMTDSTLEWLYPYNQTVWPQGLLPPLLQWSSSLHYTAISVKLVENGFSYQGYFAAPANLDASGGVFENIPIDKTAWNTLSYSNQGEPVNVTITFATATAAYGPVNLTWTIAQGTLTGTIYYQSYGTALVINYANNGTLPNFGAATLAIKNGATSPTVIAGTSQTPPNNSDPVGCRVCHSVAASGNELITQHGTDYNESSSYDLGMGNAETVMNAGASTATFAFAGIAPNGMFLLSNAGNISGINPPATSGLFTIATGAAITSTGLPTGFAAATPSFSPDGTQVAFNEFSVDKRSLASMGFDETTNTFSPVVTLDTPPSTNWDVFPAFLPTNDAVVFERQLAQGSGEFAGTRNGSQAELWWTTLTNPMPVALANLNGVGYLPAGPNGHTSTADTTLQYEPTVNPVATGGYAWVVFTSRRMYGNVATQVATLSDPRDYNATENVTTKKLWVAAIDLNAAPGTDPSHPAFYLPAQELYAGNARGYWVVDPCEATGASCIAGDQCCSGYCGQGDGGLVCGTQPPGCAVIGNKCTQTSDCCGSTTGISCVDGFCAQPVVPHDAGGCTPTTCQKLGFNCGPAGNGCGGLLQCGNCSSPQTCGGGGTSGVCGGTGAPP
jgi:hypothetical protein